MKRLLFLIGIFLLPGVANATFSAPAQAVFNNACAASSSCAVTVSAIGAGHLLVVVAHLGNTQTLSTVTAAGETFTVIPFSGGAGQNCPFNGSGNTTQVGCAYVLKSVGGATTVICNWSGTASASNTTCGFYEVAFTAPRVFLESNSANGSHGSASTFAGVNFAASYLTAINGTNDIIFQIANVSTGTVSAINTSFVLDNNAAQVADAHRLNTFDNTAPTWTNSGAATSLVMGLSFGETYDPNTAVAIPATTPSSGFQVSYSGSVGSRFVTIIAPGQFELVFEERTAWGLSQWYDLVNDAGAITNLLGPAYPAGSGPGPHDITNAQPGLFQRTYYALADATSHVRSSYYYVPLTPRQLSILEYNPSRIVIQTKSEPTVTTAVYNNLIETTRYYIYPNGQVYIQHTTTVTNAVTIAGVGGGLFSDVTLEDPTQAGTNPPDSKGWIRASTTQNPYTGVGAPETYLFAYWGPGTPAPYTTYTKASVLLVRSPNNLHDHGQILHTWSSGSDGFGVMRWGWDVGNGDTISLGAGGTETEDMLIQLGTQGSTVLPNITSSAVAGPIAAAYIANPTPPIPATQAILSLSPAVVNQGATMTFTATDPGTWSCAGTDSSGAGAACAGSIVAGTGVYTAPAAVTAQRSYGGFQLLPNNHVFNTRIDSLGVHATSVSWMQQLLDGTTGSPAYLPAFPLNFVTSATPTVNMKFFYGSGAHDGYYTVPSFPNIRIEGGWFSARDNQLGDHHLLQINTASGQFSEFYQYYTLGLNGSCLTCNSQSGIPYSYFDYALPASSTDAAGLELMPLSLGIQEFEQAVASSGTINHALRMTMGQGRECSCSLWPATTFATDGAYLPFGVRARLKSTFPIGGFSAAAQVLLTQLQQYGLINADGGNDWQINGETGRIPKTYYDAMTEVGAATKTFTITNTSLTTNVATYTAVNDLVAHARVTITGTNGHNGSGTTFNVSQASVVSATGTTFTISITHADIASGADTGTVAANLASYVEFVDESGMQVAANETCPVPSTCGLTTHNRETVTFTRTSDSATASIDVALQGPALNLPQDHLYIQAGSPAQQLTALTNMGSATWSWSPAITGGTLTSGGLLTPPATIASVTSTTVTATSTLSASVAAQMTVYIFPTGTIYVLPGQSTNYTDTTSHLWNGRLGTNMPDTMGCCNVDGSFPNITDKTLWSGQVGASSVAGPDARLDFIVPNGSYQVKYNLGSQWAGGTFQNKLTAQGATVFSGDLANLAGGIHLPLTITVPNVSVTDNHLSFVVWNWKPLGGNNNPVSSLSIASGASPAGSSITPGVKITSGVSIK